MKLSLKQRLYGGIVAIVLGLFSIAYVHAQNAGQQLLTLISTDLIQVYRFGTAAITYASPQQITSQMGYYKSAPPNLFTFTFGNTQSVAAFDPAGTLTYGYVTLAPSPSDGAQECIFSTAAITTLYLSANTSQSINDAVTTLAANARVCYIYGLANTTWDRSQ